MNKARKILSTVITSTGVGVIREGEVCCMQIRHDDWCAFLSKSGPCNCNPETEMVSQEKFIADFKRKP